MKTPPASSVYDVIADRSRYCVVTGDCRKEVTKLASNSVHSLITDAPFELGYMSADWDRTGVAYDVGLWKECRRVVKPGGHLLVFASTRTYHRMACAVENAGFQIRDQLTWLFATGFNKVGYIKQRDGSHVLPGWGGSLKPACEPILIARKPYSGTLAKNLSTHGTGGFNVDACRVELPAGDPLHKGVKHQRHKLDTAGQGWGFVALDREPGLWRWPANVLHDGSPEVCKAFASYKASTKFYKCCPFDQDDVALNRIFFSGKASPRDRDEGLAHLTGVNAKKGRLNTHPTVKPTSLMRYLARLVTPANGVVLDMFTGAGSTGKAAMLEGFRFLGFELCASYARIARARIEHVIREQQRASHRIGQSDQGGGLNRAP